MTFFHLEIFAHLERMAFQPVFGFGGGGFFGGGRRRRRRAARQALNEPQVDPDRHHPTSSESESESEGEEERGLTKEQYNLIVEFKILQMIGHEAPGQTQKRFTLSDGTRWTARHLDQYTYICDPDQYKLLLAYSFPPPLHFVLPSLPFLLARRTTEDGPWKACHSPEDPDSPWEAIDIFMQCSPCLVTITALEEYFRATITGISWEKFREENEERIEQCLMTDQPSTGFETMEEAQEDARHRAKLKILLENQRDNEEA